MSIFELGKESSMPLIPTGNHHLCLMCATPNKVDLFSLHEEQTLQKSINAFVPNAYSKSDDVLKKTASYIR